MSRLCIRCLLEILCVALFAARASAQISDGVVKIGILNDMSGPYADAAGKGSVVAAQMAVSDFGNTVRGAPIELVSADHQNKPDIATAIARRWFDREKVDAIVDLPVTSIALAVQQIGLEKKRTIMITSGATSDITSKFCNPTSSHWIDDTQTLTAGTSRAVLEQGGKTWYFLTVDHAFGNALQRQVTDALSKRGGKVVGASRFPIGTSDFASYLVQAQSSNADVIALAAVGDEFSTAVKQANEFGLMDGKRIIAGFLVFITDVHALGLSVAQHLTFSSAFYWDQSAGTREFSLRFFAITGKMPTKIQALTYTAVKHYLRAIDATDSDESLVANRAMRAMPVEFFGKSVTLRADGRLIYDPVLYRVKTPAESKRPWDYFEPIREIPASEAFLPMNEACATP
ncbi:ABC transporter substrate-binding protein [Bradyrhizobium sp. ma5]|uniref:ABC transporter substrate-binding protein n=1 Tax=Bradyrhizobium sp. ma5 TaxID=3344828 RepID=UPI0035D50235